MLINVHDWEDLPGCEVIAKLVRELLHLTWCYYKRIILISSSVFVVDNRSMLSWVACMDYSHGNLQFVSLSANRATLFDNCKIHCFSRKCIHHCSTSLSIN